MTTDNMYDNHFSSLYESWKKFKASAATTNVTLTAHNTSGSTAVSDTYLTIESAHVLGPDDLNKIANHYQINLSGGTWDYNTSKNSYIYHTTASPTFKPVYYDWTWGSSTTTSAAVKYYDKYYGTSAVAFPSDLYYKPTEALPEKQEVLDTLIRLH